MKHRHLLSAIIATLLISACGGGSSNPAPSTLSGVAAVGSPIVNGTVQGKCAAGNTFSTTTNSTGAWAFTISGQTPPCALEVRGGTINGITNTTLYHTIATSWGTANITPLTDLMVANLSGQNPGIWFAGLTGNMLAAITDTSVNTALGNVREALAGLVPLATINPVTIPFTAVSGNTSDDMLTALQTAITNSGSSYATLLSSASSNTNFTASFIPVNSELNTIYPANANAPTITAMSTSAGAAGSYVAISGTNFSITPANNTVRFSGTQATVWNATTTWLYVSVPSGATSGTVSVTTSAGTATWSGYFTVSGG